jgi:hypothetical protein
MSTKLFDVRNSDVTTFCELWSNPSNTFLNSRKKEKPVTMLQSNLIWTMNKRRIWNLQFEWNLLKLFLRNISELFRRIFKETESVIKTINRFSEVSWNFWNSKLYSI